MILPTWPDLMKFSLPENPIIFDIGGYLGTWVDVAKQYHPDATVYVFEPVKQFYDIIVEKHKNNPSVKVFNLGISNKTEKMTISLSADGSSVHKKGMIEEEIQLKDICEFLRENNIDRVHLAKINIEGEEYNLLEHLLETEEITKIDNLCIQFHTFVPDYASRRAKIIEKAKVFYDRPINYEMVFECWTMKNIKQVYCIGDSHISVFSNHPTLITEGINVFFENYSTLRLGPWLAYKSVERIGELHTSINQCGRTDVILCFGEIDCRAQVHRISESTGKSYNEIVKEIIDNLFTSIESIKDKKIHFLSVAPEVVENPHHYYYKDRPQDFDCPKGTMEQRTQIKDIFNLVLSEECKNRGYGFLNIHNHIKNSDHKKDFFLDDIHLKADKVQYLIKKEMLLNGIYTEAKSTW